MPHDNPKSAQEALEAAVRRGATMEEIARLKEPKAVTPDEAIRLLKEGNARFFGGTARRPEMSANERRAQILAQTPFAAVLGCSDSRVPIEIIFDQGLGDIFAIRVVGHLAGEEALASVEYAVHHLKCHVVVVLGHEGCGAVAAAMQDYSAIQAEPENIRLVLQRIRPALSGLAAISDDKARMREAVVANVRAQVAEVRRNPVITAATEAGQIKVIGAYYEISSGAVDFYE